MKKNQRRKIDVLVLSDIHLGTYGCRAKELLNYLKTVHPKTVILNGDIIDIWQFSKRYFPKSHMKIIKYFTSLLSNGVKIYYITGNHDEMLRKFEGFTIGDFQIQNKLILNLDGKKVWIFHGDVFDFSMKYSNFIAKLGGKGYDLLILINTMINWCSEKAGYGKISLSKRVKNGVKKALEHINNFEETASQIALENKYDYVVCGHIHQPKIKTNNHQNGQTVTYLNSGDWIENLTSLEYNNGEWKLYKYHEDQLAQNESENTDEHEELGFSKLQKNQERLFNDVIGNIYAASR